MTGGLDSGKEGPVWDIRVEGADREILSKEDKRIAEIVEHLQETSESKDDVCFPGIRRDNLATTWTFSC